MKKYIANDINNQTINLPSQLSPFTTKPPSHSQRLLSEPQTEFATEQMVGSPEQSVPRAPKTDKVYIAIN